MEKIKENNLTVEEKLPENEFGTKNITPLFWKYSFFALIGMGLQSASVIADGIFVGQGIGPMGFATISIVVPFWTITVATIALLGIGGSTIFATKLGQGDAEGARDAYGTVIIFSFILSVIIAIIALLAVTPLLKALGATEEILPYAKQYAVPFFLGLPLTITGSVCYYFTRADGRPIAAAIAYMGSAALAILAEYILILKLDFNMEGSSIPWVICVGFSFFLIPYLQVKSTNLKIKVSDFKLNFSVIVSTVKIGFAIFAMQICTSIVTILINRMVISNGGNELHISAFGIINAYIAYFLMIVGAVLIAGMQPIASFNFGAKKYGRLAKLIKVSAIQGGLVMVVIQILFLVFAEQLTIVFAGNSDPVFVDTTAGIIRIFLVLYALGNISQLVSGYFQAVGKNILAIINGIARAVLFTVPLLFILPPIFGLKGVWMAQPGADFLAFILAIILMFREYKAMKAKESELDQ